MYQDINWGKQGDKRMIYLFDGHCDVLYKMWDLKNRTLFYQNTDLLHSSFDRLLAGGVRVQTMAVFVPPGVPKELRSYAALQMIELLHHEILQHPNVELIKSLEDLQSISINPVEQKLYILLSIEGADPLQGDLTYLRIFYSLGVRSIGLTWNYRNEAADGVREKNPSGLSNFGYELIREMNRLKMSIDISHLAEKGFWDCVENSEQPIMASHCNSRALFDHPRNLSDEQVKAIYQMEGIIGINFVPFFHSNEKEVQMKVILNQIDYMLSLGGEDFLGFGSDFDGIDETIQGLENSAQIAELREECLKRYPEKIVKKLFFENWRNYYQRLWET